MAAEEARPCWLYRMFDEVSVLLYVGISINPAQRLGSHQVDQPWWDEVADVRFQRFPSKDAARAAERTAIRSEQPKYNINGKIETTERPIKSLAQRVAERAIWIPMTKPAPEPTHHLAQVNISLLKAPLDSPQLADFVADLEPVNALADAAPGFVWRLQTDDGDATSLRVFGDDRIIINLTVWTSIDALYTFAYRGRHLGVLVRRREWFEKIQEATVALWWVPIGQVPTTEDAKYRLDLLRRLGPTPEAFTFKQRFDPPAAAVVQPGGRGPEGATAGSSVTGAGMTPSSAAAVGSTQSRAR